MGQLSGHRDTESVLISASVLKHSSFLVFFAIQNSENTLLQLLGHGHPALGNPKRQKFTVIQDGVTLLKVSEGGE